MGPKSGIALALLVAASAPAAEDFADDVRAPLVEHCSKCHPADSKKNHHDFLKARAPEDIQADRGLWRDVAIQLRNRTMPPVDARISEDERLRIATWIDAELDRTACLVGDFAGAVAVRRLNRREYGNTIRDLLGVEFNAVEFFPGDGSGGEGFDTNGETLYVPPLLMERYLEAAQEIVDRVIVSPPAEHSFRAAELEPLLVAPTPSRRLQPGGKLSALTPVYLDGEYDVTVEAPGPRVRGDLDLEVDGVAAGRFRARARNGSVTYSTRVTLGRGMRLLSIVGVDRRVRVERLRVEQRPMEASPERLAAHYRLLGTRPGEPPLDPHATARKVLERFLPRAYRRPIQPADVERLLELYDRSERRGDPYEERMKLVLKAALVWPDFLFKIERRSAEPGIHPLSSHEIAVRLSYLLWATMPDAELRRLADQDRLQDDETLHAQVDRMLDDPRARRFTTAFVGQWLGTADLGGRKFPMLTELRDFYGPEVAADLRAEPVLLFERILKENRSLVELLDADYTFLTERLVKYYQLEQELPEVRGTQFQLVRWPDERRAGVTGMAATLAATSHYKQTSPVLRGAWILEALLGTPVPPPPPDVPLLEQKTRQDKVAVGMRQTMLEHSRNPSCATCHNLIDPLGFALENFDWTGRWRNAEADGSAIDASASLPSGETFEGPQGLRETLIAKKDEFLRQLTAKTLGYALGRSLTDGDSCTVRKIARALERDGYRGRTLIHQVVGSIPFRNSQGGEVELAGPAEKVRIERPKVKE